MSQYSNQYNSLECNTVYFNNGSFINSAITNTDISGNNNFNGLYTESTAPFTAQVNLTIDTSIPSLKQTNLPIINSNFQIGSTYIFDVTVIIKNTSLGYSSLRIYNTNLITLPNIPVEYAYGDLIQIGPGQFFELRFKQRQVVTSQNPNIKIVLVDFTSANTYEITYYNCISKILNI